MTLIQESSNTEHRGPCGGEKRWTQSVSGEAGSKWWLVPASKLGHLVVGGQDSFLPVAFIFSQYKKRGIA